eukprot:189675_1
MSPSKWNIYTKIDDIMYLNLYNYNFWQCEYDHDETQNARVRTGHVTNYDWTRMDVVRFYFLEWFTDSQRKVHHSVCHGDIVVNEGTALVFRGVTMSQYLDKYSMERECRIQKHDELL